MDPRLEAWIREHCGPSCYGEQDENGIDLSLIRENLRRTPLERIRMHDRARRQTEALLEAGRRHREKMVREDDLQERALRSAHRGKHSIVELLIAHGVEFIVIGGQAETLHGSARVTFDTDLCYRRTADNLRRLAAALRELNPRLRGAPPDLPVIFDERALALGTNYTFDTVYGSLDLLGWVEPIGTYEELVSRAEEADFDGILLKVIALDDLIRIKEHLRRPKDRDSLMHLLAIKRIRAEGRRE